MSLHLMNHPTDKRTIALDSQLATRPFKLDAKWAVITGAPCAGETAVLEELSRLGFEWNPEIARLYIERQLAAGLTLQAIRADEGRFQRGLINAKVELERGTNPNKAVFFDRGMPDSITYYRVAGFDPKQLVDECFHRRYAHVFILDRLPLTADHATTEDEQTADFLDRWLEQDYRVLGCNVIRVPVMPVTERVDFVLSSLRNDASV